MNIILMLKIVIHAYHCSMYIFLKRFLAKHIKKYGILDFDLNFNDVVKNLNVHSKQTLFTNNKFILQIILQNIFCPRLFRCMLLKYANYFLYHPLYLHTMAFSDLVPSLNQYCFIIYIKVIFLLVIMFEQI